MKKLLFVAILSLILLSPAVTSAQSMVERSVDATSDGHTDREEAEGKKVWDKLQAKQVSCDILSDDDFGALGEYFMGRMAGSSHESMNTMMEQMMGKQGEEQVHVVMGKRLSGCVPSAEFPQNGAAFAGFMPIMGMIQMMKGGGNSMMGYGNWNNMMGGWGGLGILGWLPMFLFWLLLILGIVALLRFLGGFGKTPKVDKTPLEILKERYAKSEIDKKEFAEKKKDLE